ncbi:MAG: TonB family protein, partial [Candidatus Cloacimonetes bacterium]|nr:TonB family protein [Candidatus Cloacimonadota bacterium]
MPFDDPPLPIGSINPVYPEFARKNGIQGTVVLEVEVLKDGSVRNIH